MKRFRGFILLTVILVAVISVASADRWQIQEDGDWIHLGGVNSLDGIDYLTREGLKEMESHLDSYGYISFNKLPSEDVNLLLSAENEFWFTAYSWYPFYVDTTNIYVDRNIFYKAIKELKESPLVSDLIYEELIASTAVITYIGENAKDDYGTAYNKFNEKLIEVWEEALKYNSDIYPEYVILLSPIDCDVILTLQSTLKIHHFKLKANVPVKLLLFDQCYITYINGINVSDENIQTPSYTYDEGIDEKDLTLDLSKVIKNKKIESRAIDIPTVSFGMSLSEWLTYYEKAPRGESYKKPTWTKDGPIVNTEPYIPDDAWLEPDKDKPEEEEKYDISMYLQSSNKVEVIDKIKEQMEKETKRDVLKFIIIVVFVIPFFLALIVVWNKKRKEKRGLK